MKLKGERENIVLSSNQIELSRHNINYLYIASRGDKIGRLGGFGQWVKWAAGRNGQVNMSDFVIKGQNGQVIYAHCDFFL